MTMIIRRRGRSAIPSPSYVCYECGVIAPALVTVDSNPICKKCVEKALAMFSDPELVATKTPLSAEEKAARAFATKVHGDQKYDSGTEPYVVHLAEVRDVLVEFGWDGVELLVSAWLHDAVEDTKTGAGDIAGEFNARVAKLVWAVTGLGGSRKERNEDAYKKMVEYPDSIPLKLADRLANARASKQTSPDALFEMYKREHHASFKDRLQRAGGVDPRTVAMWKALDDIFGAAT